MAKQEDITSNTNEQATPVDGEQQEERLTTLQKIKQQAEEGDEAPSSSLKFSDILGGEFLWTLVRKQAWLIILVVAITWAYVATRYQCQQDAIDISQLERDLINAKFESLSSSSNLTRKCRQSNVLMMLNREDSTQLESGVHPPFIIEIPQEK